jgi:hypothetical protein
MSNNNTIQNMVNQQLNSGKRRKWEPIVMAVVQERVSSGNIPFNERKLAYLLEGYKYMDKSNEGHMNTLSKVSCRLRLKGQIKRNWMVDYSRRITGEKDWESEPTIRFARNRIESSISNLGWNYQKSLWDDQDERPLFIMEKETMTEVFETILQGQRLRIVPSRGYPSFEQMCQIVEELPMSPQIGHIFVFTDCDSSGYGAIDDLNNRIPEYQKYLQMDSYQEMPKIDRLALDENQVKVVYHLSCGTQNPNDTRNQKYKHLRPYMITAELDQLDTKDLKVLIDKAVQSCINDPDAMDLAKSRELWNKKSLDYIGRNITVNLGNQEIYPIYP